VSTQILRLAVGDFVGGELKLARKAPKSAKPYSQLENEKAPWTKPSVPVGPKVPIRGDNLHSRGALY
jgi:hypothetical protein